MKYIYFDVEDFTEDDDFINWVKSPNPESDFFWNSFLTEYPEKTSTINKAKSIVAALNTDDKEISEVDIAILRSNLIKGIDLINSEKRALSDRKTRYLSPIMNAAAVITFLIAASAIFFTVRNFSEEGKKIIVEKRMNPNGQRSTLMLPDGSKVWLNGGSKITYLSNLNHNGIREVFLEGEAFFDVVKDKSMPFVVKTPSMVIKVLGTKFNVKSYFQDLTVETTLVEGSVRINETKDNLVLRPNEKAVFSKKENTIELIRVDPAKDVAWKDGKLIIENESFLQVSQKLERWYGVKLEVKGGEHCKLNFKIAKESLTEVLENLRIAMKMNYHKMDDKIVIEAPDCVNM